MDEETKKRENDNQQRILVSCQHSISQLFMCGNMETDMTL